MPLGAGTFGTCLLAERSGDHQGDALAAALAERGKAFRHVVAMVVVRGVRFGVLRAGLARASAPLLPALVRQHGHPLGAVLAAT